MREYAPPEYLRLLVVVAFAFTLNCLLFLARPSAKARASGAPMNRPLRWGIVLAVVAALSQPWARLPIDAVGVLLIFLGFMVVLGGPGIYLAWESVRRSRSVRRTPFSLPDMGLLAAVMLAAHALHP